MSIFSKIEKTRVKSNTFDLSHDRKFSCKMGQLVPTMVMDLVPGDKFTFDSSLFTRFAPLTAPVMHRVNAYMHYFFVPNRILWPGWEEFITGGKNGNSEMPWAYFNIDYENYGLEIGTVGDYLGLPIGANFPGATERPVNALPFAAYQRIWIDYYRDQNLQDINEGDFMLVEGSNGTIEDDFQWNELRYRSWQHDYFTSALPWTQKGPAALLPLYGTAQIKYDDSEEMEDVSQIFRRSDNNAVITADTMFGTNNDAIGADKSWSFTSFPSSGSAAKLDLNDSHYADLSTATAVTINDLRQAFKLQEWLEKNARGGSRYIESIAVHFGVQSSDRRLQRPEFIGGFRSPVQISEVLQNAPMTEIDGLPTTPQGNMAGHALSIGGSQKFSYYAEEHGYIIGIMSVMPKTAYFQGIPKHFLRRDRFDYFWPEFANIGEQPIEMQEIWQEPDEPGTDVFGYTPRYAEYKYVNDSVHGEMRTTLDFWHMGRKFSSKPALNEDFIVMDPSEVTRIFAVEDGSDHLWCHVLNNVKANRKMPYFGTPKM